MAVVGDKPMLIPFFYSLRALKVPVGIQEWLYLMQALLEDLHNSSLDKFYFLARSILIKSEAYFDAYDQAFLICFKGREGEINLKEELKEWLDKSLDPSQRPPIPDIPPLTLEELRQKFLERLREQNEEHHGGEYWIGTGGRSPFGHSGSHPSGMRIGGPGGGRMAVKVAEERKYRNYRNDRVLDIRQFQVALKRLRRLEAVGVQNILSIDKSIDETCKNAGEIELVFEAERKNQMEVLLFMDVGGSMDPYAELMDSLFSAAHSVKHFKTFQHFFFHNCLYSKSFTDMHRNQSILTGDLYHKYRKSTRVIFVGDACMNPYELFSAGGVIDYWDPDNSVGIECLQKMKQHFPQTVWLNPEPEQYWNHPTIRAISRIIPMFPLTVNGLTEAVDLLKKQVV